MSEKIQKNRRRNNRSSFTPEAVIKGHDGEGKAWEESTDIINISKVGASFNLPHECVPGRIVSIVTDMPQDLRRYDLGTKSYRVCGLVQHCRPVREDDYEIGVAFIGKFAPDSYSTNPRQSYRITGMNENGFWDVTETTTQFISRAHYRFPCRLEVGLVLINSNGEEVGQIDKDAEAQNISAGGAAILTSLDADVGDRGRFISKDHNFSSMAVVCNSQKGLWERTIKHLNFTEEAFPIKELVPDSGEV